MPFFGEQIEFAAETRFIAGENLRIYGMADFNVNFLRIFLCKVK
jgi:hypothetical protein